jgi:hypothetical protein
MIASPTNSQIGSTRLEHESNLTPSLRGSTLVFTDSLLRKFNRRALSSPGFVDGAVGVPTGDELINAIRNLVSPD